MAQEDASLERVDDDLSDPQGYDDDLSDPRGYYTFKCAGCTYGGNDYCTDEGDYVKPTCKWYVPPKKITYNSW